VKRSFLLLLSFLVCFSVFYVIPPNSTVSAATVVESRIKVTELVRTSDNSFHVVYQILTDMESFETLSIKGSFSEQYRGAFPGVGISIKNKKKGTYSEKISAPAKGQYGWLTFSTTYFASGGRGYEDSKYLATQLVYAPDSTKFHTVTAAEASFDYFSVDVAPGLIIWLYNINPRIKIVASTLYTSFTHLVGYSETINRDVMFRSTKDNYIKTDISTSSSGVVTMSFSIYTNKESYTKGVSSIHSYKRTFSYPK